VNAGRPATLRIQAIRGGAGLAEVSFRNKRADMGQFRKLGVGVALGALLAPQAPALAAQLYGATALSAPCRYEAPGPYPVGYDGASATPTGYGVVYNVPPAQNLTVRRQRENGGDVRRGGVVSAAY
jgi:hypothetical protein